MTSSKYIYKQGFALHDQLINPGLNHDWVSIGIFLICVINGFYQLKTQPFKKP